MPLLYSILTKSKILIKEKVCNSRLIIVKHSICIQFLTPKSFTWDYMITLVEKNYFGIYQSIL